MFRTEVGSPSCRTVYGDGPIHDLAKQQIRPPSFLTPLTRREGEKACFCFACCLGVTTVFETTVCVNGGLVTGIPKCKTYLPKTSSQSMSSGQSRGDSTRLRSSVSAAFASPGASAYAAVPCNLQASNSYRLPVYDTHASSHRLLAVGPSIQGSMSLTSASSRFTSLVSSLEFQAGTSQALIESVVWGCLTMACRHIQERGRDRKPRN